jgi:outer membrane protein OmpA-like peptidoglycan-associated protein
MRALVDRGVPADHMRSAGYGERCPVERGTSTAARDANRRVELVILRSSGQPTGVGAPCTAGAVFFVE